MAPLDMQERKTTEERQSQRIKKSKGREAWGPDILVPERFLQYFYGGVQVWCPGT